MKNLIWSGNLQFRLGSGGYAQEPLVNFGLCSNWEVGELLFYAEMFVFRHRKEFVFDNLALCYD